MLSKVFGQVRTKTTAKAPLRNVEATGLLRLGDCGQFIRWVGFRGFTEGKSALHVGPYDRGNSAVAQSKPSY